MLFLLFLVFAKTLVFCVCFVIFLLFCVAFGDESTWTRFSKFRKLHQVCLSDQFFCIVFLDSKLHNFIGRGGQGLI